ncbi:hypothetical protein SAMN05421847_0631 [Halpernia humi]|uniref:Periplasmic heavy metal sensor n=1 Tax=Halpernia humi TaxID=493375 RepID=A0A1H5U091_9FLAO|nr:hypothetical protein [Halpernia humi]SEF68542.1 hypothetical protein SAMN05421847_0631 [Halpernia humi]
MNKTKFLIAIIIGLLISHAVLFFLHFNGPNSEGNPRHLIIRKLHFDKDQVQKYDSIIKIHRNLVRENEMLINQYRNNLYKELDKKQDSAKINLIIKKIGLQQENAEKINYKHFLEIKSICKPSQEKDFSELTQDLAKLFSGKIRKPN